MEIGTSPRPGAPIIVNWPGRKASGSPYPGSSQSVTVSSVSRRLARTTNGRGVSASAWAGVAMASVADGTRCPVQVEQADPGRLQALVHHVRHARQQLEADV